MLCVICNTRKPRRRCPAVQGDICTVCCAEGREESLDCPLDCEYLREAHRHQKQPDLDFAKLPNSDIEVTEEFLQKNEVLMAFIAIAIFESATEQPGITDWDIRQALESLIDGYKVLKSGIIYEPAVVNLFASGIADKVRSRLSDIRERETAATGRSTIEDAAILGVLAFFQRLEYSHNNGRKRCRAFIDFLNDFYSSPADYEDDESLDDDPESILEEPDEPLIIL